MFFNEKMSEGMALVGTIDPVNQSAGTITSGWVSASQIREWLAIISTGILGTAATVDAKIQQAQDNSGTGAKDVTGKAISQIVKASGDNKQAMINFRTSDLDVNGGFGYVRISLTVGTAASQVAAHLLATTTFQPADSRNQSAVVQVA